MSTWIRPISSGDESSGLAVGAVGLTGLVGTSAAETLHAGTDGGGSGPNKKACYWESECGRYNDGPYGHYVRECCPDSIDPTVEHCTEWEYMDDQMCLSP